jgi:LysM repeat protein
MRRTTICRSSRVAVLALAATLSWRVLPAQDTTQVAQDTTQLIQDTQAVAAFQGQVPTSHTVVRGETLWSISQMYFNDPLLWLEIYRLNTSIVDDPHWIYPGEVLNLAPMYAVAQGGDTVAVAPDTTSLAADTVRASGDTVVAIVPLDTNMAPIDTIPADTAGLLVEQPPPPIAESNETIFDRRRTNRQVVQDVLRAYANQPSSLRPASSTPRDS